MYRCLSNNASSIVDERKERRYKYANKRTPTEATEVLLQQKAKYMCTTTHVLVRLGQEKEKLLTDFSKHRRDQSQITHDYEEDNYL